MTTEQARALPAPNPATTISNQIVRLLTAYVGRGPTRVRTSLCTDMAFVTFEQTMSRGERSLVVAGEADAVRAMRQAIHRSMRAEAIAAIGAILNRTAVAFLSDIDTDADIAVMVFVFEPRPDECASSTPRHGPPARPGPVVHRLTRGDEQ